MSNGNGQRVGHIQAIGQHGRVAWKKMKARKLPLQKAEDWERAVAPNRMTSLGMPVPVKI